MANWMLAGHGSISRKFHYSAFLLLSQDQGKSFIKILFSWFMIFVHLHTCNLSQNLENATKLLFKQKQKNEQNETFAGGRS